MIDFILYYYIAASGRNVVTVVHFIDSDSPTVAGDALSEGYILFCCEQGYMMWCFKYREINDLNRGRLFISDIFHSSKVPHFKSLDQALEFIVQVWH